MKDNIKNNSATLDMLKALNPNIKKDFNGDNTKSYFCNVVKEETNKDGELEIVLKLSSILKRLDVDSYRKLLKFKTIDIAVCGCNSAGAVITSSHVLTISLDMESFLLFSKLVSKSKFFKKAVCTSNGRLLYKFNIKVYDKHELNIDKSLSNFSDPFVFWYLQICKDEETDITDIDAVSDLATRLFDEEWCSLDFLMYNQEIEK